MNGVSHEPRAAPFKHLPEVEVSLVSGDTATILTGVMAPPGSRVSFEVVPRQEGTSLVLSGKIVAVRASGSGRFLITVRLFGLSRAARELLAARDS